MNLDELDRKMERFGQLFRTLCVRMILTAVGVVVLMGFGWFVYQTYLWASWCAIVFWVGAAATLYAAAKHQEWTLGDVRLKRKR